MMRRSPVAVLAMALATYLISAPNARAGTSTQGFSDVGTPKADGSATGDINTAMTFTLGDLESTTAQTGFFVGMPTQDFGSLTFNTGVGTSLTLSSAVFGTFSSTSITVVTNVTGYIDVSAEGDYTHGTYPGSLSAPADLNISFTQAGGSGSSISDSATVTLSIVPEPGSLVMGLTSIAVCGLICRRRRRRTRKAGR